MNENLGSLMKMLEIAYPTAKQSGDPESMMLYIRMLEDIDIGLLAAAVKQHIANSRFFPTISELRESALAISTPVIASAAEAWGELSKEITSGRCCTAGGATRKPELSNPISNKILSGMNFRQFYFLNAAIQQKIFISAYEAIAGREAENARLLPEVRMLKEANLLRQIGQSINEHAQLQAHEDGDGDEFYSS